MKKLVSVFLILALLMAGLMCFALAEDSGAVIPQIQDFTPDEEGNMSLSISGEGLPNYAYVNFTGTNEEYGYSTSWSATLYLNEETGKYEGTQPEYAKNYSDVTLAGFSMSSYDPSDPKYSDDRKTQTTESTRTDYTFDADKNLKQKNITTETTVSKEVTWTYSSGDSTEERNGWATTSKKTEQERLSYKDGEITGTENSVEDYTVKAVLSSDTSWISSFYGPGSSDYEIISASKVKTAKGTTESDSDYNNEHVVTEQDLTTTYSLQENQWGYTDFVEDTVVGTKKETRTGSGDITSGEYDDDGNYISTVTGKNKYTQITTTTYSDDGKTRTVEKDYDNKEYDLNNQQTREYITSETSVSEKTSWTYKPENGDSKEYSDYATKSKKTESTNVTFKDGAAVYTSKTADEYEVKLADSFNKSYMNEFYGLGSSDYDIVSASRVTTAKGTNEFDNDYNNEHVVTEQDLTKTHIVGENYWGNPDFVEDKVIGFTKETRTGSGDIKSWGYDDDGNYVSTVTGKNIYTQITTTTYDEDGKTRTVEKDFDNKEYDLNNKQTGSDSVKSTITAVKQDVEYTDRSGEKQTVNGYVRTAENKETTEETYKDGKLYYTSTDKTEATSLQLKTENISGSSSLDYDSSYDIVKGTTTAIRKGSLDDSYSEYDDDGNYIGSKSYKYRDVDETTVTTINDKDRKATVKKDDKYYNRDGKVTREEKQDSEVKYALTKYEYNGRWNEEKQEYEKQTAYGYAATSTTGTNYRKSYDYNYTSPAGESYREQAVTTVYDRTLALNQDNMPGWNWTTLDPDNYSSYYTVKTGSEKVTDDSTYIGSNGKTRILSNVDEKNIKDGEVTDSKFDHQTKVDNTLTRREIGDSKLEKDGNTETLTTESTIRSYSEEDGKQISAQKKKEITTDTYEEKEYGWKQNGETVKEKDRKIIATATETTTTVLDKNDKQSQVQVEKTAYEYEYVEKARSKWDSEKQESVEDPDNTYIAQRTKAGNRNISTKTYSVATGNLTGDNSSEYVYSYKDGNQTGSTAKSTNKEYFNNVLIRDYSTESVTTGYGPGSETPEQKTSEISYYKLTGNLKRENESETKTEKEKDADGNLTKKTVTSTEETKNYIDKNPTGERKENRTATTVYTNKEDAGSYEYYRDQETTNVTKTTGKNYNRYSGKLLSTYEEESETTTVRKNGSYSTPHSKTVSKTYDPEGNLIASSESETTRKTEETESGKTETYTSTSEGFDKETGKTSGNRTETTTYDKDGARVSEEVKEERFQDDKQTYARSQTTKYDKKDAETGKYSPYTYNSEEKSYDAKTGKLLSSNSNSTVTNYDENGYQTDTTTTTKSENANAETGNTTYTSDSTSKYVYKDGKRTEYHSESTNTNFDSKTGKKTNSTSSKSDSKDFAEYQATGTRWVRVDSVEGLDPEDYFFDDDGWAYARSEYTYTSERALESSSTRTEKSYNKDTGAEVSGSINESSSKYRNGNQLLSMVNTYTVTGADGKTVSATTTKETHDYSEAGSEVSVLTTKDGTTYDRDTFALEYTTHEEHAEDYVLGTDKTAFTKTNAANIIVETRSEEKNIVAYDNDDMEKATTRTEKNTASQKMFDEETGKEETYARDTEKVWTYRKDDNNLFAYDNLTTTVTTSDRYGTTKDVTVEAKDEVKLDEYDKATGKEQITTVSLVTNTVETFNKNNEQTNKTVTETRNTETETNLYKESEDGETLTRTGGETVREKAVTTTDEKTHITKVETETATRKTSVENGAERVTTYSEGTQETQNGVKISASTSTTTFFDDRKLDKDGNPETQEASKGYKTVNEEYHALGGTTRTESEEKDDYVWDKDNKAWTVIGTTWSDVNFENDRMIRSETNVKRDSVKTADDKLSKTEESTSETTVIDEDNRKTVEKTTTTTQYKRAKEEDTFEFAASSYKDEIDGTVVRLNETTRNTAEDKEKNTTTRTETESENSYYQFNGKARKTYDESSTTVVDNSDLSIGDYMIASDDEGRRTTMTTTAGTEYWKAQLTKETGSEEKASYDYDAMAGKEEKKTFSTSYDNLTGKKIESSESTETTDYRFTASDFINNANDYTWTSIGTATTTTTKVYTDDRLSSESTVTEKDVQDEKDDKKWTYERTETEVAYDAAGKELSRTEKKEAENKARSAYSNSMQTLDETVTTKEWQNGVLTLDKTDTTVNTYTDEAQTKVYTVKAKQYDNNGSLIRNQERTSTSNYDRTITENGESFSATGSKTTEKQTNKNGKVIYAYEEEKQFTEDEETGKTRTTTVTKSESFDYLGNRISGEAEKKETLNGNTVSRSNESYNRFGVKESTVYTYDDNGNQTGYTWTQYDSWNGKNYKATVFESNPEDRKDAYGNKTGILTHTTGTSYDRFGAMTRQETVDEAYDEKYASTVRTKTTTDYVGKDELHQKKVEETVNGRKGYDDYYSKTTTVTDFEGKQVSRSVYSREQKDGKYIETRASYNKDEKNPLTESVTENGTDKNGYSYTEAYSKSKGVLTSTESYHYNEKEKGYVRIYSDYDKEGKLTGKREVRYSYDKNGASIAENKYFNKDNLVYTVTSTTPVGDSQSTIYTDKSGKQIGFSKTDADGNRSSKVPMYDSEKHELTGAWNEYSEKHNEKGELTSSEYKVYDKEGKLDKTNVYADKTTTETWYHNPGNALSRTLVTMDDVLDDKNHVTEQKTIDTWYALNGKKDHSVVTATRYEYDEYSDEIAREYWYGDSQEIEYYGKTRTVTTTEYRNGTDALVVKKTIVDDAFDDSKDSMSIVKADGTEIGYRRMSADGTTVEELEPDFETGTGYVYGQTATVTKSGKDGSWTSTAKRINAKGFVTSETTTLIDKDRNETETSKEWDPETKALTFEQTQTTDGATGKVTTIGTTYRWQTGTKASSMKQEMVYDKEKGVNTIFEEHFSADGKLVYTVEGTTDVVAGNQDGNDRQAILNLTWKDSEGAEIGYRTTDAKGNVTEKIPKVNDYNGKLTGAWTESTYDLYRMTSTSKEYDKDGRLTSESTSTSDVSGKTTEYWPQSRQAKNVYEWTYGDTGLKTSTQTLYNLDGSTRKRSVTISGRETGSHLETTKTTYYSGDSTVLYTYERVNDLQKDEETVVYKDAKGKKIGYVEKNDDGSYTYLTPVTGGRYGAVTGFTMSKKDADGQYVYQSYDEKMNPTWGYRDEEDAEGNRVTSYYRGNATQPYEVRTAISNGYESDYYRLDGTQASGEVTEYSKGNTIVNSSTKYYNDKGEMTYSILEITDASASNSYTVYLDKNGKEFARSKNEDNGNEIDTWLEKTYANNVIGWEVTEKSGDGKVEIRRAYTADGTKKSESYQRQDTVYTDDATFTTVTDQNGMTLSRTITYRDEDGNDSKQYATVYSPYSGARVSAENTYYAEDGSENFKHFIGNGNMTYYGRKYYEDDWGYRTSTWANGREKEYSWWDLTEGKASLYSGHNPNGTWGYWQFTDASGNEENWQYDSEGNLSSLSKVHKDKDGVIVTDTTTYAKDGSISGYIWNQRSSGEFFEANDAEIWNASTLKYYRHSEEAADFNGWIETRTDLNGNVRKIVTNNDTKKTTSSVTLANPSEGWNLAFGDQWYYVENGKPVTGWKELGGVWYAFDEGGAMVDGVYNDGALWVMNASGAYVSSGWAEDSNGNWYYADENGQAVTGWKKIDGVWYYFADGWDIDNGIYGNEYNWTRGYAGNMVTGAVKIWNGDWSGKRIWFFRENGSLDETPGWKSDGIDYYYYDANGGLAVGWRLIDGQWYYFDQDGVMRNGWVGGPGEWYYLNETGEMAANQWIQERFEDDWYYADSNGTLTLGWQKIDGTWYFFNDDGRMASNQWTRSGSDWYYMGGSGAMTTGWQEADGVWYFFNDDGRMASDQWVSSGGKWYYMNASGAMAIGWKEVSGTWYYFESSGAMATGWKEIGGSWYYFLSSGAMATGQVQIGDTVNNFDGNGVWTGAAN